MQHTARLQRRSAGLLKVIYTDLFPGPVSAARLVSSQAQHPCLPGDLFAIERDDEALPQFDRQELSRHNGSLESGGRQVRPLCCWQQVGQ